MIANAAVSTALIREGKIADPNIRYVVTAEHGSGGALVARVVRCETIGLSDAEPIADFYLNDRGAAVCAFFLRELEKAGHKVTCIMPDGNEFDGIMSFRP